MPISTTNAWAAWSRWCLPTAARSSINLQKPLHEIWMAAKAGGYHYTFSDGQVWQDTKGHGEFFAHLSQLASEQSGLPLQFA